MCIRDRFHALRKMNIPTVIFINKIDQAGVDLQSVIIHLIMMKRFAERKSGSSQAVS